MAPALPSKASFDTFYLDRSYSGNDLHPVSSSNAIPINWTKIRVQGSWSSWCQQLHTDPTIPDHLERSLFRQTLEQILIRPKNKDRPKSKADQATPNDLVSVVELHQQPK